MPAKHAIGRERVFVSGMWVLAATLLATGFVMRPMARFLGGPDLRILGMIVMAAGVAVALLGWLGEKLLGRDAE